MSVHQRILVCSGCEHLSGMDCRFDAATVSVVERAKADHCPAGKFVNLPAFSPPSITLSSDARQLADAEAAGLGDDVERLAKALGADKLAKVYEELTGWDCGCDARKRLLNKLPSVGRMLGWLIG